jgi:hypothetical protein
MAVNEHDGLEEDGRLASLYRAAAREEPPAHLDRAIAAAARERPARPAPPMAASWWIPWRLPFTFAALAVVCVSLVTLMIEEDGERIASVPASPPTAAREREEAKIAQQPAEAPAASAAPKDAEISRRSQRQDSRKPEPPAETAATSAGRGESARAEAPPTVPDAGPQALRKSPALEAPPAAAQDALGAAAPRAKSEVQAPLAEERPAAPPPPPFATAPAPATVSPAAKPAPAPMAKPAPARKLPEMRAQESERYAIQARPSPEVARHIAELEGKPPSAWIERAIALRREGRAAEADGLLAELRRRFPGESLPAELQ